MAKEELQSKIGSGFANQFQDRLEHEATRKKFIEIFDERVKMVDFADLVKKYASEEMDRRVFTSFKYWAGVIGTAILTSAIGLAIGYYFKQ